MAQDQSNEMYGGDPASALVPTGQHAGGVSGHGSARTAPGSPSPADGQTPPVVGVQDYDEQTPRGDDGASPWDDVSGRRLRWGP